MQGHFELDGVAFAAAEIGLSFLDPAEGGAGAGGLFPTGRLVDELDVPGIGRLPATLINAGIPTVFVNARDVGCSGTERQADLNGDAQALARFEAIRAQGALKMNVSYADQAPAPTRQDRLRGAAVDYRASGRQVRAADIDLLVRAVDEPAAHAMMGTAAVAIATAAPLRAPWCMPPPVAARAG